MERMVFDDLMTVMQVRPNYSIVYQFKPTLKLEKRHVKTQKHFITHIKELSTNWKDGSYFLKSPKARGLPKKSDSSALFIEEAGKTKITLLTHTAKANSLSHLTPGDKLMLNPQGWCVSILDPEGKYVGRLDEFVSSKLKTLIKKGNKYEVLLRSINQKCVEVFIKEITKSTSHSNSISFPI